MHEPVEGTLHHSRSQQARSDQPERERATTPTGTHHQRDEREREATGEWHGRGARSEVFAADEASDDSPDEQGRTEHEHGLVLRVEDQIETRCSRSLNRRSPMPRTSRSSLTDRKPPRCCRSATIACARTGPIPGRASNCAALAVLRLTGSGGAVASPPVMPRASSATGGSPLRTTSTRWPSTSFAARLRRSMSASGSAPPVASSASTTRDPAGSSITPGVATAPATCTTISDPRLRRVTEDGGLV